MAAPDRRRDFALQRQPRIDTCMILPTARSLQELLKAVALTNFPRGSAGRHVKFPARSMDLDTEATSPTLVELQPMRPTETL
jgi:DNA primase